MAIVFNEEKNKQKKLIFLFAGVMLITGIVIWKGVLKKDIPFFNSVAVPQIELTVRERIGIDLTVLEKNHQFLEKLEPFPEIMPLRVQVATGTAPVTGTVGRDNPFKPY